VAESFEFLALMGFSYDPGMKGEAGGMGEMRDWKVQFTSIALITCP